MEELDDPSMKKKKKKKSKRLQGLLFLPSECWIAFAVWTFGFSGIHSFYANMSKFFITRFNFTAIEAGHISSLPYLVASFSTPLLGAFLYKVGKTQYYNLLLLSVSCVAYVHFQYAYFAQCHEECFYTIWPILIFGFGHSLLVTMQAPIV